jgi:uncharacterized SAM-binding protein YcdF (DUF218 family)
VRLALKAVVVIALAGLAYGAITFLQVWAAARDDDARKAEAIVVLGTAQYDGRPSPVLKARLDHAVALYRRKLAPVIVVTGGQREGDRVSEATAAANYLLRLGVPDSDVLREVSGSSSWQSLAAVSVFLEERDIDEVLLVSDPFHSYRIRAIAGELGLKGHTSPTRTSPITGLSEAQYMARETVAVAVGRIIGFRREANIDDVVRDRV